MERKNKMKNYAYDDFGNHIAMETSNPGSQLMGNEVLSHALNSGTNAIVETLNYGHLAPSHSLSPETNAIVETSNSSNNASPGDSIGWRDTPITEIDVRSFNPFRFSSEYHDDELNLIYYNYRHYNPATGRFLSRDPIEEQGGTNLYNFLENDGINNIDIYGLAWYNPFSCPGVSHAITVMDWTVGYGAGALNTVFKDFNPSSDEKIDIIGSCGSKKYERFFLPSGWWESCCNAHDRCYEGNPCQGTDTSGNPVIYNAPSGGHKKQCDENFVDCIRNSAPLSILGVNIDLGISNRIADQVNDWLNKKGKIKSAFEDAYLNAHGLKKGDIKWII